MDKWSFYKNSIEDSIEYHDNGAVTIHSVTGKLNPFDPDRMSFYYTRVPAQLNFKLSATMKVNSWEYTNGQEGMGLAALDRMYESNASGMFWNNLLTVGAGKLKCRISYGKDPARGTRTIRLKQGIMAREKTGITPATLPVFTQDAPGEELWELYDTRSVPLMVPELTDIKAKGIKDLNLIGNRVGEGCPTVNDPLTEIMLSIIKNDDGYILSYTDEGGREHIHNVNDREALEHLDPEYVYTGVFAARRASVTFENIRLEVSERRPVYKVTPKKEVRSCGKPERKGLIRRAAARFEGLKDIYVSPDGQACNSGACAGSPVSLGDALSGACAGSTVHLLGGRYVLKEGLIIPDGVNGREGYPIILKGDGDSRAVLDFDGTGTGFKIHGSYWEFEGFDVTKSADGYPGIRCCGSHNRFRDIYTYENGNTGLQISAKGIRVVRAFWPEDVIVSRCVSYNNADSGRCDADGFAAKLTCGEDVIFTGCLSFGNADDGFDLYAKPEAGPIGDVRIENCIAYDNRNGFKLGGSYVSSCHQVYGCLSIKNKNFGFTNNHSRNGSIVSCVAVENGQNLNLYGVKPGDYELTDFVADRGGRADIIPLQKGPST